jgi:cell division protein ZapA (FtsZ GTPase activity inhibitor)
MRHMRAIIALFSLTLVWHTQVDAQSHETATGTREDTSGAASAVPRTAKDQSFDASTVTKSIVDEASRLKNDAVEWGQKLQEIEADLRNNQNVDGAGRDVDQYLVVLRTAADRLAPNSETRVTLRKQEDAIRDLAIRAEVHSDQAIRKIAGHFQQKTSEMHAVNRSLEEVRIRLITAIDRLEQLKVQLEFNHAAAQNDESLKEGKVSVDNIQTLTADAQRVASDLQNINATPPVAGTPVDAPKPADARKSLTKPPTTQPAPSSTQPPSRRR